MISTAFYIARLVIDRTLGSAELRPNFLPNIKYLQIPIVVLALLGLILISVTVTKMLKEMKHVDKMFSKKSRDVFISS